MAKSSTGMYPQCQKHGISPEIMDRDLTEVEYITNALVMELNSIRLSQNCTWQKISWLDTSSTRNKIPMCDRCSIYLFSSCCCD